MFRFLKERFGSIRDKAETELTEEEVEEEPEVGEGFSDEN